MRKNADRLVKICKILIVSGCVFEINFLVIYPIYVVVFLKNATEEIIVRGLAIALSVFLVDGIALMILLPFCSAALTKNKSCQSSISYGDFSSLSENLAKKAGLKGYYLSNSGDRETMPFWLYQKNCFGHSNYLLVLNDDRTDEQNAVESIHDISSLIEINVEEIPNCIILYCCNRIEEKRIKALKKCSREGINNSYFVAIVNFEESKVFYNKLVDGFAAKRQHKKIDFLKYLLSIKRSSP